MTDNDAPVSVGEQVGRYLVEAEFSKPSWGWLFVARHATLRHKVLLKFISGDSVEFLQHEAQILARLKHPNILAIRDIDTHNQQAYLVLDYVEGGATLADMVHTNSGLLPTVALHLMATLCSAVGYAHAQGLIHADITPRNIIIGLDGTPVLIGFYVAEFGHDSLPSVGTGLVIGSSSYMSPERWKGAQLTMAADIWSIGVTLYELLTGRVPYDRETPMAVGTAIVYEGPVDLSALREQLPQVVLDILAKCLQKDPAERYASAEALRQALNAAIIELELSEEAKTSASDLAAGEQLLLYSDYLAPNQSGHFRHYQIQELIGSGTFADVYQAIDTHSDREVALKILKKYWLGDEQAVARFRREALLLARLSHPNIVSIYDFGQYGEHFYLVLELVVGHTLADYLRAHAVIEPKQAAALVIPMLAGLDAAHRLKMVHRDLKPQNIVLADRRVVILDFGIAFSAAATRITEPGVLIGSAAYMSPEQARQEQLTTASDIYAVGTILYEMMTGRYPHESEQLYNLLYKLATEAPVPITVYRSDLPSPIVELVARLHHPNPHARPSAREAAELLAAAVGLPLRWPAWP